MSGRKTGAEGHPVWRWLSALGFLPTPARPKRKKRRVVSKKDVPLPTVDTGETLDTREAIGLDDPDEYKAPPREFGSPAPSLEPSLSGVANLHEAGGGGLFDPSALRQIDALFEGLDSATDLPLPVSELAGGGATTQIQEEQSFFGEFGHVAPAQDDLSESPAQTASWREARIPLPVEIFASPPDGLVIGEWPPAKVLSLGSDVDLVSFLSLFSGVAGVAGALLIGRDGLVIASTLDETWDAEFIGAQTCTLFMGNQGLLQRMAHGELRRLILETDVGTLLMLACDGGIVTIVSERDNAVAVGAILALVSRLRGE